MTPGDLQPQFKWSLKKIGFPFFCLKKQANKKSLKLVKNQTMTRTSENDGEDLLDTLLTHGKKQISLESSSFSVYRYLGTGNSV